MKGSNEEKKKKKRERGGEKGRKEGSTAKMKERKKNVDEVGRDQLKGGITTWAVNAYTLTIASFSLYPGADRKNQGDPFSSFLVSLFSTFLVLLACLRLCIFIFSVCGSDVRGSLNWSHYTQKMLIKSRTAIISNF